MGKLPSCQLPLQPRVSLMDALGYLRSVLHWAVFFFNPFFFFFFQKAEGVGFGAILYLLWVSDTLPSSWKSPAVPYFAHAQHS